MDAFALDQQGISLYLSVLFYIAIRNAGAIGAKASKIIVLLRASIHKKASVCNGFFKTFR